MASKNLVVRNSSSRQDDCVNIIQQVQDRGNVLQHWRALSAARLGFANSQTFCECGKIALRPLSQRQYNPTGAPYIASELNDALEWFKLYLTLAPPRTLRFAQGLGPPVSIYSDGWQSGESPLRLGLAVVLWDRHSGRREYFSWVCV